MTVLLVVCVVVLVAAAALRIIAPLTKTSKDDEALKLLEKAEPLAEQVVDKAKRDAAEKPKVV